MAGGRRGGRACTSRGLGAQAVGPQASHAGAQADTTANARCPSRCRRAPGSGRGPRACRARGPPAPTGSPAAARRTAPATAEGRAPTPAGKGRGEGQCAMGCMPVAKECCDGHAAQRRKQSNQRLLPPVAPSHLPVPALLRDKLLLRDCAAGRRRRLPACGLPTRPPCCCCRRRLSCRCRPGPACPCCRRWRFGWLGLPTAAIAACRCRLRRLLLQLQRGHQAACLPAAGWRPMRRARQGLPGAWHRCLALGAAALGAAAR